MYVKEYAYSHCRHWPHFDLFVREALYRSLCKVETPPEGTVFEHFFEFSEKIRDTTNFINCSMRKGPQLFFTSVPQVCLLFHRVHINIRIMFSSFSRIINCTVLLAPIQYEKHAYLLDMLLDVHEPVLVVGESGSGKTMLCKSVMSNARPHMHLAASLGLHPSELCKVLKRIRYQKTQVRSVEVLKQPNFLLFIDDLHQAPFGESLKEVDSVSSLKGLL